MLETVASIHFAIRDIVVGNAEVIRALEHLVTLSTKRPSGKLILPCRLGVSQRPQDVVDERRTMRQSPPGRLGVLDAPILCEEAFQNHMFMKQTNFALLHHVIGVN